MRAASVFSLALLLFAAPGAAQTAPDSTAPPPSDSARVMDPWQWRGAPPSNEAALQLYQVGRDSAQGRSRVLYKALALGFSPGERVALWAFPLGPARGTCMQAGFVVDSTGRVTCPKHPSPDSCAACLLPLDQILLAATGYARGEPYRAAVISADGRTHAYAQAFPFPVEAHSDSLHVWLEMLSPDALEYQIVGEGFPEGQTVGVTTRSVDRSSSSKLIVPPGGVFRLSVMPQVPGHPGGFASATLSLGKHQMTLEWDWGDSARH